MKRAKAASNCSPKSFNCWKTKAGTTPRIPVGRIGTSRFTATNSGASKCTPSRSITAAQNASRACGCGIRPWPPPWSCTQCLSLRDPLSAGIRHPPRCLVVGAVCASSCSGSLSARGGSNGASPIWSSPPRSGAN